MTDLPKRLAQVLLEVRPSRSGIGGQQVTGFDCLICRKAFSHGNTAVPLFCPGCERDVRALASRTESEEEWVSTFALASCVHLPIHLRKFSENTNVSDVKINEMPEDMRAQVTATNIGRVWSARVGSQRRWHFAWTARAAVNKALHGGGIKMPRGGQLERELEELERSDPRVGVVARELARVTHDIISGGRKL